MHQWVLPFRGMVICPACYYSESQDTERKYQTLTLCCKTIQHRLFAEGVRAKLPWASSGLPRGGCGTASSSGKPSPTAIRACSSGAWENASKLLSYLEQPGRCSPPSGIGHLHGSTTNLGQALAKATAQAWGVWLPPKSFHIREAPISHCTGVLHQH